MVTIQRRRTPPDSPTVHQLEITLDGITPPIWRRVLVHSNISLRTLHKVIQATMGWDGDHLHEFKAGKITYRPAVDMAYEDDEDERKTPLNVVAPRSRMKFTYLYDFGDSWKHVIRVEKISPTDHSLRYPVCIDGARAGPPDDCGGTWGYQYLIEALADPNHPGHGDMLDWIGSFDPEAFDLAAINARLARRLR